MTLKTGVIMLKIINNKVHFKIYLNIITLKLFYCISDQISEGLVSIRDCFKKKIINFKLLNGSVNSHWKY